MIPNNTCKLIYSYCIFIQPVPVTKRSKSWVCDLSLAGIAGVNPASDIEVCLFLNVVFLSGRGDQSLKQAHPSSRRVVQILMCHCV
jgi:hypothetical protein